VGQKRFQITIKKRDEQWRPKKVEDRRTDEKENGTEIGKRGRKNQSTDMEYTGEPLKIKDPRPRDTKKLERWGPTR